MNRLPYCFLVFALLLAVGCGSADMAKQESDSDAGQHSETRLVGQPDWFPLGTEVYHVSDVSKAQQETLEFVNQPRWFMTGDDVPESLQDLATDAGEAELQFRISETNAPATLRFFVKLRSPNAVLRQYEHRWNNTLPLLFAFYVDGKAVKDPDLLRSIDKSGGAGWCDFVIRSNESKTWEVTVDANSILDLLPDRGAHEISVVVAFSECQHEGFWEQAQESSMKLSENNKTYVPTLIVRSEPATIDWDGKNWNVPAGMIEK